MRVLLALAALALVGIAGLPVASAHWVHTSPDCFVPQPWAVAYLNQLEITLRGPPGSAIFPYHIGVGGLDSGIVCVWCPEGGAFWCDLFG